MGVCLTDAWSAAADAPPVDGSPPHMGLCRRGFNLIGKIQPVLIEWNPPDGVESSRWGGILPMGWSVGAIKPLRYPQWE